MRASNLVYILSGRRPWACPRRPWWRRRWAARSKRTASRRWTSSIELRCSVATVWSQAETKNWGKFQIIYLFEKLSVIYLFNWLCTCVSKWKLDLEQNYTLLVLLPNLIQWKRIHDFVQTKKFTIPMDSKPNCLKALPTKKLIFAVNYILKLLSTRKLPIDYTFKLTGKIRL